MQALAITSDKEGRVILKLAGPMALGMLGLIVFNLVDTFFVGRLGGDQLGGDQLAALTFTFPVIMVLGSIAHGLNAGITASVSQAAGQRNQDRTAALVTRGLLLALMVVAVFSTAGILSMEMVFTRLGADETILSHKKAYMRIWYPGAVFFVIPAAINAALYGLGDTRTPSKITLATALFNAVLDPFLIFGIGPFPALGVAGAATATVIARGLGLIYLLRVPAIKKMIAGSLRQQSSSLFKDWGQMIQVGLPNMVIKLVTPFFSGMITKMVAAFGSAAVAGFGIALRLEMLGLIAITAVAQVMPVFIGQNMGARKKKRMQTGISFANRTVLALGAVVCLFLFVVTKPVARLINPAPDIVCVTVLYMKIVPVAYGFYGVMQIAVSVLTVMKKPVLSTAIVLGQVFAVFLPLSVTGTACLGLAGIFGAVAVSCIIAGIIGARLNAGVINKIPHNNSA